MTDPLVIAGTSLKSRLFAGTAGYPNQQVLLDCLEASGVEIVTVSIRRISLEGYAESLVDLLGGRYRLLPNTAGCATVRDAVLTAELAREALDTEWLKLELIGDRVDALAVHGDLLILGMCLQEIGVVRKTGLVRDGNRIAGIRVGVGKAVPGDGGSRKIRDHRGIIEKNHGIADDLKRLRGIAQLAGAGRRTGNARWIAKGRGRERLFAHRLHLSLGEDQRGSVATVIGIEQNRGRNKLGNGDEAKNHDDDGDEHLDQREALLVLRPVS